MLKKIKEPLANYEKKPVAGESAGKTTTAHSPAKRKGLNWKIMGSLAALIVFVGVGAAGVLTAQKQFREPGPVAPNAPSSVPQAAEPTIVDAPTTLSQACSLTFTVTEEPQSLLTCNDVCENNVECQATNPNWICSAEEGDRCRLAENPSSEQCKEAAPTYSCKSTCTTDAQCQTADEGYICSPEYGNTCRLAINLSSETCQLDSENYACNSSCDGDDKCITANQNYICSAEYGDVCRLKTNPSSTTCQPISTGNAQCDNKLAIQYKSTGEMIEKTTLFKGSIFRYRVEVSSKRATSGDVVVTDTLPNGITYVAGSARKVLENGKPAITPTVSGQKLTFNLGTFSSADKVILEYQVKIDDNAAVGSYTNKAVVTTNGAAANTCQTTISIPPTAQAVCEEKIVLTDYDGEQITLDDTIDPGDSFVYQISVVADDITKGAVSITDVLPNYIKYLSTESDQVTYNSATNTVTADLGTMSASTKTIAFKVQMASNALPDEYLNEAIVATDAKDGPSCPATVVVSDFECNATCATDAQCQSANADYICSADNGDRCRLDSNRASSTCQPKTFACDSSCSTDSDCQSVNDNYVCADVDEGKRCRLEDYVDEDNCQSPEPTPTPTPAPGCNEECSSNSDCTNPDHICYTTDDGNVCRLADYVNSESCTKPSTKVTTTTTTQPDLPEQLPQTGPEDWVNWLKAGLITLGIGALLLLLL